jgi:hypothetical protein
LEKIGASTAVDELTLTATTTRLVTNCGLYIVDINLKQDNLTCIACASGYYIKTYDAVTNWKVTECGAITGCTTTGTALNRCSGCVWKYDTVTDTISTNAEINCIKAKEGNCFAGTLNGGSLVCNICDPGYELISGKCMIIKVPRCEANSNNYSDIFNSTNLMLESRIFQYSMVGNKLTIPGCNQCESSTDILYLNTSNDDFLTPVMCSQILNNAGVYDSTANTNYVT